MAKRRCVVMASGYCTVSNWSLVVGCLAGISNVTFASSLCGRAAPFSRVAGLHGNEAKLGGYLLLMPRCLRYLNLISCGDRARGVTLI